MPGLQISTQINAGPDAVWRLLCDATRYAEWVDPTDRMVHVPDGDMTTGFVYKEYGGIPPFKSDSTWTVTEFDPPRRQVHLGDDGTIKFYLDNVLQEKGGGTLFTQTLRMTPKPWMAPVMYLMWLIFMKRRSHASIRKTQQNFKALLEAKST